MSGENLTPELARIIAGLRREISALQTRVYPSGAQILPDLDDVYINVVTRTDGDLLTWVEANQDYELLPGGGVSSLIFAKQMYGSVNDPGGGAPTDPSFAAASYGGLFSEQITDPSADQGGWIGYSLKGNASPYASEQIWGTDPALDFGYRDVGKFHRPAAENAGDDQSDGYDYWQFVIPSAVGSASVNLQGFVSDSGPQSFMKQTYTAELSGDTSEIEIAANPGSQGARIRLTGGLGGVGSAELCVHDSNPNGVVTALQGSLLLEPGATWRNTNGATAWTAL